MNIQNCFSANTQSVKTTKGAKLNLKNLLVTALPINMKQCVGILNAFLLSASSLGLFIAADKALATPVIEVNLDSGVNVNGSYLTSPLGRPNPAVYQVYAGTNECIYIIGTTQTVDVEATLISPSGRVWQNDDGGGNNYPFIKAITPVSGWNTLQLSHFSGGGSNGTFTFFIGRYPSTSSFCSSATTPNPTVRTSK